jgi:hypothetical protein
MNNRNLTGMVAWIIGVAISTLIFLVLGISAAAQVGTWVSLAFFTPFYLLFCVGWSAITGRWSARTFERMD